MQKIFLLVYNGRKKGSEILSFIPEAADFIIKKIEDNGYEAYLPTEDQLCRGGYEVDCFLYCGAYTLVNNADQIIINENLKLLK